MPAKLFLSVGIVSGFLLCVTIIGNAEIDNVDITNEENFESSERR